MKKYLMGAALSTIMLAGCQNEEIVGSGNAGKSELTVQVTKGISSRLEMNQNGKMVWSEGDQLFVYGTKACGVLTLVDGAGKETATFSGFINGNESDIQYAAFGFDKSSTPENVTFTLGTVNADESNAPMFGTFNSSSSYIELGNLCGLVKVTISDMVDGKDGATITGKGIAGTLKLENGKLVPGTADATITVEGIGDGESFYVPMFAPQDKTPIELTVTYNGAIDKQMINLKAGALNVSDMPESYYYKDGENVLYSDDLYASGNQPVDGVSGVLKNKAGEYIVSADEGLESVLDLDEKNIVVNLASDLTVNVEPWQTLAFGGASTETITINGNGNTLTFNQLNSDWNHVTTYNSAKLIINNAHITNSGHNNGPWNRHDINFACPVELVDVISDKAIALKNAGTLTNVTIKDNDDNESGTYAIWIQPIGQTITLDGCTIDMLDCVEGRGIKIDNQYLDSSEDKKVALSVSGTKFKTEGKSAILVKSNMGADITLSNNDITEVAADKVCAVWVDDALPATFDLVNVTGGNKRLEGKEYYSDANGNILVSTAKGITDAITDLNRDINIVFLNDIEGDAVAVQKDDVDVVIDGNGKIYDGTIYIDGKNKGKNGTGTIRLVDIDFETKTEKTFVTYASNPSGHASTYPHNITIEDCDFKAIVTGATFNEEVSGINFNTPYTLKITGCTATNMHSLLQAQSCDNTVVVESVTVTNCKNGISFGNTAYPSISNSTINSVGDGGYGVRCDGNASRGELKVTGCNVSGENPIVVRKMTTSYSVELSGNNSISAGNEKGYQIIFTNGDDGTFVTPTGTFSISGAEGFKLYPEGGE